MNAPNTTLSDSRKGWLLILVVVVGGAFLGLGSRAVVETSRGADFDSVFNEPARTADDAAEITWLEGEPLLRSLEPQTIDGIELAWTRALSAVGDAATDRGSEGIDVWFSGPAQDQVRDLLATGTMSDDGLWISHAITPDLYSIDGQILAVEIDRTRLIDDGQPATDAVRVIFILRDGNWRIEHLERIADLS